MNLYFGAENQLDRDECCKNKGTEGIGLMRIFGSIVFTALVLTGCGSKDGARDDAPATEAQTQLGIKAIIGSQESSSATWEFQSSGEGVALVYSKSGNVAVRLFCAIGANELLVNVPAFGPVGSEDRLSIGSGSDAVALVADTRGDKQRGGVSGTGAVPENLLSLVSGPISVNYGDQNSGPYVAPIPKLARAFAAACTESSGSPPRDLPLAENISACLVQHGNRLRNPALQAVGTEPFWVANVTGRCVTYSHPDDQDGIRVWTHFKPAPDGGGTWSGSLGGRLFELTIRSETGCSDGMSEKRYQYAAALAVDGERRSGCALLR